MHYSGRLWGVVMAAASLTAQIGWHDGWQKQRSTARTLVVLSATVRFQGRSHVGLIRDMSRDGLYVYSDFAPKMGDTLRIELRDRDGHFKNPAWCTGIVVRVESKGTGAAVGIAVKITEHGQ